MTDDSKISDFVESELLDRTAKFKPHLVSIHDLDKGSQLVKVRLLVVCF